MKDSKSIKNFFTHDSGARNDEKLLRVRMRYGAAGYGIYFMLLERLREETGYTSPTDYEMIAFDLRESTEMIKSVVEDFGLFETDDEGQLFWSVNFLRRMEIKDAAIAQRRSAAQARWKCKTATADDSQMRNECDRISEMDATAYPTQIQPQSGKGETQVQRISGSVKSQKNRNAAGAKKNKSVSSADGNPNIEPIDLSQTEDIAEFLSPNAGLSDLEQLEQLSDTRHDVESSLTPSYTSLYNNVSADDSQMRNGCDRISEMDATAYPTSNDRKSNADARREEKRKEEKRKKVSPRERLEKSQRSAASGSPALKEVEDLMAMESLPGDAKQFFNYYEARGWQLDGEPVYDWKALLRSWALREKKLPSHTPPKPTSGVSKELENIAASEKRKVAEEQARKVKEMEENPQGLTSAQILAQVKKKHGINPDQPITAIQ